MHITHYHTNRREKTQYCLGRGWYRELAKWFSARREDGRWERLGILTDTNVWNIYEEDIRRLNSLPDHPIIPVIIDPGEDSKEFNRIASVLASLNKGGLRRRDLLICFGGGVCCDVGGFVSLLYFRGIDYVNVPTSMMAQVDAAIGGKVGVNFGIRKNFAGGFHHPKLVIIDPSFLDTLPDEYLRHALAECVKIGIIRDDLNLLDHLAENREAVFSRQSGPVLELLKRCLHAKLELLGQDPYENNLDRPLNLGHGVAHALEMLPVLDRDRKPSHGEAVAIGLAATTRYAVVQGYCSPAKGRRIITLLSQLGLPTEPKHVNIDETIYLLSRIPEHRGGQFRFVVPLSPTGVRIIRHVDVNLLVECLSRREKHPV